MESGRFLPTKIGEGGSHGNKVYFCDSIGRSAGKEFKGVINM